MEQAPRARRPSPAWTILAGLAMVATLLVDGVLLWGVVSYPLAGRPQTPGDWIVAAVLASAMVGALVVLLRLIGRRRPGWLGLLVAALGLALPGGIALQIALSGPPFIS